MIPFARLWLRLRLEGKKLQYRSDRLHKLNLPSCVTQIKLTVRVIVLSRAPRILDPPLGHSEASIYFAVIGTLLTIIKQVQVILGPKAASALYTENMPARTIAGGIIPPIDQKDAISVIELVIDPGPCRLGSLRVVFGAETAPVAEVFTASAISIPVGFSLVSKHST